MAPFMDQEMNQLMTQYYSLERDPKFLYQGSQDDIVKELQAWVVRREKVSDEQIDLRGKILEATLAMKTFTTGAQHDAALAEGVRCLTLAEAADNEELEDTARAAYLLHTLKHRGVLWPKLWWRPDCDGGVCSFLGTIDRDFDPDATLAVLEDQHREEHYLAKKAEIEDRIDAKTNNLIDDGEIPPHGNGAGAALAENTEEGSVPEKKNVVANAAIPTSDNHPAKWAKILKAVSSGRYPDIMLDGPELVAFASNRADSEIVLKDFLADVFGDLDHEWVRRKWITRGPGRQ